MQSRSPAAWVLTSIFAAVAAGSILAIQGVTQALATLITLILFAIVLLPFLFLPTFDRESRRHFTAILWSHPFAPAEYALGKALAGIATSGVILTFALGVAWLTASWQVRTPVVFAPWLTVWPVLLVMGCFITVFALLCIRLAPIPILGAFASAALLFNLAALRIQTLLAVTDLTTTTLFYAPSVGTGPDTPLLTAQRLFYLALSALGIALLIVIVPLRERRALMLAKHWLAAGVSCLLLLAIAAMTFARFQSVAASYIGLGPIPANPVAAGIQHYQLAVTLVPGSATLSGNAVFTLVPRQVDLADVYIAMNPGLRISQVTALAAPGQQAANVPYTSALGWIRLDLARTPAATGNATTLHIAYAGWLALSRDAYAQPAQGYTNNRVSISDQSAVRDYVGQGLAFLAGSGDWYPTPWTQASPFIEGIRPAFDTVTVRIPAHTTVFSSIGTFTTTPDGQWKVLAVHPAGSLPDAFLAALASPTRVTFADGTSLYYDGTGPNRAAALFDQDVLDQAQRIDHWLSGTTRTWRAVIVPLLNDPILGPGLVLIPDWPVSSPGDALSTADTTVPGSGAVAQTQADVSVAAQVVATAWWFNAIQLRYTSPVVASIAPQPDALQDPTGTTEVVAYGTSLTTLLAGYTAGVSAAQVLGPGFLATDIRERSFGNGTQQPQFGFFLSDPSNESLALFRVAATVGLPSVTHLLRRFAREYTANPATVEDFEAMASSAFGVNFQAYLAPYLVNKSGQSTQGAGGA